MTRKTKKWLPMAAGLMAVAVLGFGYTAVTKAAKDKKSASASAASVSIASLPDGVDAIEYTNAGAEIALVKNGDIWQWEPDADFPLQQSYAKTMAAQGAALTGTALVRSDGAQLEQYGLDSPAKTVTLHSGSQTVTCLIGSANSYTGDYYLMLEGGQNVYTVSSNFVTAFSRGLSDLLQLDTWPVTSVSRVRSAELDTADGTAFVLHVQNGEDGSVQYTLDDGSSADADAAKSFLSGLTTLSMAACVNYKADAALLADSGLNAPAATLTVTYADAASSASDSAQTLSSAVLYVGSRNTDGTYNVRMEGSKAVNTMSGDVLASLIAATPQSLAGQTS